MNASETNFRVLNAIFTNAEGKNISLQETNSETKLCVVSPIDEVLS